MHRTQGAPRCRESRKVIQKPKGIGNGLNTIPEQNPSTTQTRVWRFRESQFGVRILYWEASGPLMQVRWQPLRKSTALELVEQPCK
jgi:hypothetical protein